MDLLDDPFCEPKIVAKAPIASKFQPKAKPRPKKPPPAAVKPTKALPAASVVQDKVSNQSVKPNVVAENKTDGMSSACIADTEDGSLSAKAKEVSGSSVVEQSEMDLCGPIRGTNLSADSSLGSKLPSDVIGLSRTTPDQAIEISNPDESNVHSEEEPPVESNVSFASASPLRPCNSQAALDQSKDKTLQESDHFEQSVCGDGDGDFQIDVEQLGAGDFSCLDTMDILTEGAAASERRAAKLMPKPKAQVDRKKDLAALVSHGLELPSENQNIVMDGSIHAGDPDTVSDNLHMRVDGNISLDHSLYQSDNVVFEDTDSMMPEKSPQQSGEIHGEKNSYDALLSSAKSVDEAFLSGFQENENGYEDGVNDEFHDNSNSPDKARDKSVSNRDEINDCDKLGEEILQKKKPRKAKKAVSENDKPTRKRKKADQKPDETIEKPPKKFPRGTRRKRCVDKTLLEAPEDELDLQRVPIKDLIILAEHKERQAKKEAAAAPAPETNERIDNSEDFRYDYDETYGSDQDRDAIDEPSTSEVLKDTGYYNYQSLMTKAPRARWTKHDTELFYQGISQFGSDLSMVQQLFPGRTRHQIKLKYKKEERQNPMRLHDALTSRSPNLSHFKLVIERLQAAQEAEADNEDSVCPTGEDEGQEEVLNTHEDGAESKKEEGRAADQEPDRPQVESPPESYHSKEEEFDWMEYESEL